MRFLKVPITFLYFVNIFRCYLLYIYYMYLYVKKTIDRANRNRINNFIILLYKVVS